MLPGVNIISGKASVAGVKGAGGALNPSAGDSPLKNFLGFNEHLDWLKTFLNAAETSTFEDYKRTKN